LDGRICSGSNRGWYGWDAVTLVSWLEGLDGGEERGEVTLGCWVYSKLDTRRVVDGMSKLTVSIGDTEVNLGGIISDGERDLAGG